MYNNTYIFVRRCCKKIMDSQKLDKAIIYVDRIANGFNPVNNQPIENESVLNNPNVIRCMYFIKDILKEVQKNGGIIGKKLKVEKESFDFKILDKFVYIEDKSITKILRQINDYIENPNMKHINCRKITAWLKENNYIIHGKNEELGITGSVVTDKGKSIGMYNEVRAINDRTYLAVMYNKDAQEFIVHNLKDILLDID